MKHMNTEINERAVGVLMGIVRIVLGVHAHVRRACEAKPCMPITVSFTPAVLESPDTFTVGATVDEESVTIQEVTEPPDRCEARLVMVTNYAEFLFFVPWDHGL